MAKVVVGGVFIYIDGREFGETRGGNARRKASELPVPVGLLPYQPLAPGKPKYQTLGQRNSLEHSRL